MMRSVSYILCKICGKQIDVYFAHGGIETYGCNYCYKRRSWLEKKMYKLGVWWRGRK